MARPLDVPQNFGLNEQVWSFYRAQINLGGDFIEGTLAAEYTNSVLTDEVSTGQP